MLDRLVDKQVTSWETAATPSFWNRGSGARELVVADTGDTR